MKKINWNMIWNFISGISVLYLMMVAGGYIAIIIKDGIVNTLESISISGVNALVMVISMIVVLIHVIDKICVPQITIIINNIKEQNKKTKKVTVKKAK